MPDAAQINRSISTIRTELEYLVSSGVLAAPQLQSIQAQLPVCVPPTIFFSRVPRLLVSSRTLPRLRAPVNGHQQPNGQPSQYIDPKYVDGGNQFNPALVAQQAQDPAHPANPNHPKACLSSSHSIYNPETKQS